MPAGRPWVWSGASEPGFSNAFGGSADSPYATNVAEAEAVGRDSPPAAWVSHSWRSRPAAPRQAGDRNSATGSRACPLRVCHGRPPDDELRLRRRQFRAKPLPHDVGRVPVRQGTAAFRCQVYITALTRIVSGRRLPAQSPRGAEAAEGPFRLAVRIVVHAVRVLSVWPRPRRNLEHFWRVGSCGRSEAGLQGLMSAR